MSPAATLKWHFPPTHGGPAQGFNDSGKEFFTADIMDHVVREIIQNSLDAKDPRHPDSPVAVKMRRFDLARGVINAAELTGHISESLKSTREKKNDKGVRFYESALRILKKPRISVLKVTDENTTGLDGARWESLVYDEGTTSKDSAAAGGSFGIGKNAPYAASALGLVCYSTRYPNGHRVSKFIARCKIVAHQDPKDRSQKLQHVGFGTSGEYDGSNYPPVLGADIHASFKLDKTGTGIFIMGFKEERGWQKAVVRSIVRNFFAAIHDKKLSVIVEGTEITNETLDEHFGRDSRKLKQYYDLYRNSEQPITVEGDGGWRLHLKIATGDEDMDNRVAYVNSRGMLITAEKSFNRNPFGPGIDAGKYVAVVRAADDATDVMVREMEPPTHESIEYKRIEDLGRRKTVMKQLQDVSAKIRKHIRERLDLETFEQKTELRELSDIIPYVSDPDKDNEDDDDKTSSQLRQPIGIHKVRAGTGAVKAAEPEDDGGDGEGDGDGTEGEGGKGGKGGGGGKPPDDRASNTRKTVSNMRNVRIVRHGGNAMRVAFDTKTGASKFVIKPVGEEYKDEPPIAIASAGSVSGAKSVEVLGENTIRVNSKPGSRVVLDVSPGALHEYTAYTILEYRARRTAK